MAVPKVSIFPRRVDFDHEAGDADDIICRVGTVDRNSFYMHPMHAAIARHDAKFTRVIRRTIGSECLHGHGVDRASILGMHVLEKE